LVDAVTLVHVQAAVLAAAVLSAILAWRRAPLWAHLPGFALALSVHAAYVAVYKEDSFITFRYAAQLLAGNGPNYNPGERVEGYTTPLWMLLSALAGAARLDIPAAMRAVAFAANLALLPLLVWFYRHALDRHPNAERPELALIAPTLVATNGALAFWAMGAMETALFTLLLVAGLGMACRTLLDPERRDWSAPLLALAYFVRPEGALFLAVTQAARALALWRLDRRRLRQPRTHVLGLVAIASIALHVAWRLWYYGVPLPNTYYAIAAVTPDGWRRGLRYLAYSYEAYLRASLHLGPSGHAVAANPLLPIAMVLLGLRYWNRARAMLCAAVGFYLGYVVAMGGEGLGTHRFTVPVFPILYLMMADGVRAVTETIRAVLARLRGSSALVGTAAFVLTLLIAHGQLEPTEREIRKRRDINARSYVARVEMAEALCSVLRPGQSIALIPAGIIPYFCMVPTIDMLGLNDAHIGRSRVPLMGAGKAAHEKFDGGYVLSRKPTVVILGLGVLKKDPRTLPWERLPEANPPLWGSEQIWSHPGFRRDYAFRYRFLPEARRWFGYFVRADSGL
jgi:hypothetical protein